MSVAQPFDPDLHHVGIGDDTANLWGLLIGGSYARRGQQNSLGKISDVGPESLIGTDRLSVWTQKNYSGGEFQRDWDDDAMFNECGHFVANQLGLGLKSVPPIVAIDNGQGYGNVKPASMDIIDNQLYVTFETENKANFRVIQYENLAGRSGPLQKYSAFAGARTGFPSQVGQCGAWNTDTRRLWVGYSGAAGIRVFRVDPVGSPTKTGITLVETAALDPPTDATFPVTGIQDIQLFGPFRLVTCQHAGSHNTTRVWNYVSTTGSSAKYVLVGTLPGTVVQSLVYNNQVYYLTVNGGITQLSMTNGSQIFPVLNLPYYFEGTSMVEYAGRLFIGGRGYDLDGVAAFGELHEVTGTSLRLVRTFKSETNRPTDVRGSMTTIRCLGVAEGLLFMPDDSSAGLEAYDATTDAFFGASRLYKGPTVFPAKTTGRGSHPLPRLSTTGHVVNVEDVQFTGILAGGQSLFLWGSSTVDNASGLFRILEPADTDETYNPYLITSDFSPEAGRNKSWSEVVAITRYASPQLQASVDGGDTWVSCSAVESTTQGGRYETRYSLGPVADSRSIRLKFIFSRAGVANEGMVEMLAHSLSFGVHASGKSGWSFNVALVENGQPRTPDEEMVDQVDDIRPIADYLWAAYQSGRTLVFKDPDLVNRSVYVSNLEEHRPNIAGDERFLNLTLLEL